MIMSQESKNAIKFHFWFVQYKNLFMLLLIMTVLFFLNLQSIFPCVAAKGAKNN